MREEKVKQPSRLVYAILLNFNCFRKPYQLLSFVNQRCQIEIKFALAY